ncbi:MAG: SPASM domain-containing protein [Candidatus Woesearchaeota archaeon]
MKIHYNRGGVVRKCLRSVVNQQMRRKVSNFKIKCIMAGYKVWNLARYGSHDFFNAVLIETSTACNRKCSYCPNSIYDRGDIKNNKLMDIQLYKKIIDELAEINFAGYIKPFNFNEPLLDKRLAEIARYTRKKLPRCIIHVATNGDFLTLKKYEELISAGVDSINITTHTKEMPRHIKDLFSKLKRRKEKVKVQYISITEDSLVNRGGLVDVKPGTVLPRCVTPPITIHINYTGDVFLCCNDYFCKYTFGNAAKEKLLDIWNNPKYKKTRKELYSGKYKYDICRKCAI